MANQELKYKDGVIPVTSGHEDDANIYARNYFDEIHVEERLIDSGSADLHVRIFNKEFSSPIVMPAFSHLNKNNSERKPMEEYALAAKELNILNFVGMEDNTTFLDILKCNPNTVRIIKPFEDKSKVLDEIKTAADNKAFGVGMDIDHSYGKDGGYDVVDGFKMTRVTSEDLKEYISASSLPFFVKGILSVSDAVKARELGAKAIVVSTHHGRMPYAVEPLRLLPAIRKAVGKDLLIILDGQVFSGYDVYKSLALGADLVMVGRGILPELIKDGEKGVMTKIQKMNAELKEMMQYTGVKNIKEFTPSVLYYRGQRMGE